MYNFKIQLQFHFPNELEVYEKLSFKIVDNIARDPECFTVLNLANILAVYRLTKLTFSQNIEQNLEVISVKIEKLPKKDIFYRINS